MDATSDDQLQPWPSPLLVQFNAAAVQPTNQTIAQLEQSPQWVTERFDLSDLDVLEGLTLGNTPTTSSLTEPSLSCSLNVGGSTIDDATMSMQLLRAMSDHKQDQQRQRAVLEVVEPAPQRLNRYGSLGDPSPAPKAAQANPVKLGNRTNRAQLRNPENPENPEKPVNVGKFDLSWLEPGKLPKWLEAVQAETKPVKANIKPVKANIKPVKETRVKVEQPAIKSTKKSKKRKAKRQLRVTKWQREQRGVLRACLWELRFGGGTITELSRRYNIPIRTLRRYRHKSVNPEAYPTANGGANVTFPAPLPGEEFPRPPREVCYFKPGFSWHAYEVPPPSTNDGSDSDPQPKEGGGKRPRLKEVL